MIDLTVLGIDTSGKTASCAVLKDGVILGETTVYTKLTHSQVILSFVKRLLEDTELTVDDIDVVAVANGPGSYTGLRIGIALVKGMCFGGKKCLGVSTLEALAQNCVGVKASIFSVMSARPGIVYFGAYQSDGEKLTRLAKDTVCEVDKILKTAESIEGDIVLVGDCAEKLKNELFSADERVRLAPCHERLQRASGICEAAACHLNEAAGAKELWAQYLQITKAEKDLIDGHSPVYSGADVKK